jgi:glycosyltransferase involved in cell wall biosynthesis
MKLAWVTPMNQHSSIGGIGVPVAEALAARGHEVEIWASEFCPDPRVPLHPTRLPVRPVGEVHLAGGGGVDLAVVHFGDNFLFHAGGLEVLDRAPVVGIFHDAFVHNLFIGWLWGTEQPPQVHRRIVEQIYGPEAWPLAQAAKAGEASLEEIAARLPMIEWVARRCQGAIVHADFYRARVEAACPGPVGLAPLTSHGRVVPPLAQRRSERIVALTVGVMNPNKCCAAVIEAIGASETLKARLDYVLAGPIEDSERERLQALATAAGVRLTILGRVEDAELERRLDQADLILCLRRPVLEGASGSAIEAMRAGRPTIVADTGFYAELPDELVVKVDPTVEPAAVAAALEGLLDEPKRRRMGAAAAAWAAETFTVERYLDALEPVLEATVAALPELRTAAQFGQVFGRMGLGPEDPAPRRALELLRSLTQPLDVAAVRRPS